MKNLLNLVLLFGLNLLFACSTTYTEQDLTIIDNLKLGQTTKEYYTSYNALGLKTSTFLTKKVILTPEEIPINSFTDNYTERFNYNTYSGEGQKHLGMFHITTLLGTDNIIKIRVLLVHTTTPWVFPSDYSKEEKLSYTVIDQNVNLNLLDDIFGLLVQKYGTPNDTMQGKGIPMFFIEKNEVNQYEQDSNVLGKLFTWDTKALKISFYTGFMHPNVYYRIKDKSYYVTTEYITQPNKIYTNAFFGGYISYEIKPEVIRKLELDSPQI